MGVDVTTHEVVLPLFSPAVQAPTKRYRTIVADPPWRYDSHWGAGIAPRPDLGYGTMTQAELLNLPVGLWGADDSHLYIWVTNSMMAEGLQLVKGWGFELKTILTWVKGRMENGRLIQHIGLGHFYRNSTEHILFSVRGKLSMLNHDAPTAFVAERHQHSEKPAAFYDMVQHMSPGPYLDVFARKQRFGWDTWGDEAFDFRTEGMWHRD